MADFNEELLGEINALRTNPRKYARKIQKYIAYFKGKVLCLPESNAGIQTEEGAEAYREAVDFLSKHSRIEALKPSKGLCRIAEEFISTVQKDSNGLESKDMEEIINQYGSFSGSFSRAMDFGGESPEQAVINLIVSDGDKSRGQRESLLSTEIKRIGVANGIHKTYRHCTAIVTCSEFENTYDSDDNGLLTEEMISKKDKKDEEENPKERREPKKLFLKSMDEDKKNNKNSRKDQSDEKGEEEELPKGVTSLNKTEKVIMENGAKKKITKIVKIMDDGSKQIETTKKVVDE